MRCQRCNRKIRSKISKERGYGPVCFEKVQLEQSPVNTNKSILITMFDWIYIKASNENVCNSVQRILSLLQKVHIKNTGQKIIQQLDHLTRQILPRYAKELIHNAIIPLLKIENPIQNKNIIIVKC